MEKNIENIMRRRIVNEVLMENLKLFAFWREYQLGNSMNKTKAGSPRQPNNPPPPSYDRITAQGYWQV